MIQAYGLAVSAVSYWLGVILVSQLVSSLFFHYGRSDWIQRFIYESDVVKALECFSLLLDKVNVFGVFCL